jgi:hypothetical protein
MVEVSDGAKVGRLKVSDGGKVWWRVTGGFVGVGVGGCRSDD